MSPEQARGQPVDPRSDIYSVGGLMFYALTGRPAFVAENYNLLIVAIVTHPAPPIRSLRSEIPPDIAAVVDRSLSADPSERFQTAAEMREALLECAAVSLPPVSIAPSMSLEPTMLSVGGTSPSGMATGRSVETSSRESDANDENSPEAQAAQRRKELRIAARRAEKQREKQRLAAEEESRLVYCRAACRTQEAACRQRTGGMGAAAATCSANYMSCTVGCN